MPDMSELTGEVIGPYQITERLGRGGMADVYKAFHSELKIYRAIKFIRPEFVTSEDFRVRFQKEAQSVARLRHPNIVTIHDFGSDDDRFYMVMEFVEGEDLKSLLRGRGAFDIARSVAIVVAVADALKYAHQRDLIHRDIKPENIMLDADGMPVLMDFGIAKLLTAETQLTQTGMGIGTPAYMAPEQAKGLEVGPMADIYSLGIVLFEMVTGQVPFSADTPMAVMLKAIGDPLPIPRSLNADISEALQGVILKATAKEPIDRYQSAAAFAADLQRAVSVDSATVVRADLTPLSSEAETVIRGAPAADAPSKEIAPRKSKGPLIAVTALVLLLATGAGYLYLTPSNPTPTNTNVGADSVREPQSQPQPPTQPNADPVEDSASETPPTGIDPVLYALRESIDADEVLEERLPLQAGDVVYLNVNDTASTTDFVLTEPGGRESVFKTYNDSGPHTVTADGDYNLSVAMRNSKSGMVDVELLKLDPPVIKAGPVAPGEFFRATTQLPGQTVLYNLELGQGDSIFFDLVRSAVTTDFTLLGPDGRTKVITGYSDGGPVEVTTAGTYTLTADPRGDKLADYEANVYRLVPPVIEPGMLALDEYVSAQTTTPGQSISYDVNIDAGTTLFFEVESASATTDFTLTNGRNQVFSGYGDAGPLIVERAGEQTFTMDPRGDKLSTVEVILHTVDPPVIAGGPIAFNNLFSAETLKPGQLVNYQVQLNADEVVYLDVAATTNTTDFVLAGPNGHNEMFSSYADLGPLIVERGGDYVLTVDPRGSNLSQFEATLYRLDPPDIAGGALVLGEPTRGETRVPGQRVAYTVELVTGSTVKVDVVEASATTDFTLAAPDGKELYSSYGDSREIEVGVSGRHTLVADPRGDDLSRYHFVLFEAP
jgi:serine/threonine protein kinase